ncbi:hypothetical protein HRR79_001013 [Exophiala dermatitidis]|nr:hypothetical protein HRR79_001013 [Exophiala dermatitidis]
MPQSSDPDTERAGKSVAQSSYVHTDVSSTDMNPSTRSPSSHLPHRPWGLFPYASVQRLEFEVRSCRPMPYQKLMTLEYWKYFGTMTGELSAKPTRAEDEECWDCRILPVRKKSVLRIWPSTSMLLYTSSVEEVNTVTGALGFYTVLNFVSLFRLSGIMRPFISHFGQNQ